MEITDKQSHNLQNDIDYCIDILKMSSIVLSNTVIQKLEEIRDNIPCNCGNDVK